MTWGKEIATLLEIKQSTGVTPKALQGRPALRPHLRHYLEAFYELSAGRSFGEAPHPIATADIFAYCQLTGVASQFERERLYLYIRRLDATYLQRTAEKIKAEQALAAKKVQ